MAVLQSMLADKEGLINSQNIYITNLQNFINSQFSNTINRIKQFEFEEDDGNEEERDELPLVLDIDIPHLKKSKKKDVAYS